MVKEQVIASILRDPRVFATSLVAILLDRYGAESLNWDMDAIQAQLHDDFGVRLEWPNDEKLQAVLTAMTTDQFYRDPWVFNAVCQAMANDHVDFDTLDLCTPEQMAWAVSEVMALDGHGRPQFSAEVRRFMGCILAQHAMFHPPDVLKLADYPPDEMKNADAGLSDEPEIYQGFYKRNREDAAAVTDYVRAHLNALAKQLHELPLSNRDHEAWAALMEKTHAHQVQGPQGVLQ